MRRGLLTPVLVILGAASCLGIQAAEERASNAAARDDPRA